MFKSTDRVSPIKLSREGSSLGHETHMPYTAEMAGQILQSVQVAVHPSSDP